MHIGILNIDAVQLCSGWVSISLFLCALWRITSEKGDGESKNPPQEPPGGYMARSNNSRYVPTDEEIKILHGRIHEK